MIEKFIVKHYHGDERPVIKGNSFDGLEIGEDREEAEEFIDFINNIINKNKQLEERIVSLEKAEYELCCIEEFGEQISKWCHERDGDVNKEGSGYDGSYVHPKVVERKVRL